MDFLYSSDEYSSRAMLGGISRLKFTSVIRLWSALASITEWASGEGLKVRDVTLPNIGMYPECLDSVFSMLSHALIPEVPFPTKEVCDHTRRVFARPRLRRWPPRWILPCGVCSQQSCNKRARLSHFSWHLRIFIDTFYQIPLRVPVAWHICQSFFPGTLCFFKITQLISCRDCSRSRSGEICR
jgi:hypothetical protein